MRCLRSPRLAAALLFSALLPPVQPSWAQTSPAQTSPAQTTPLAGYECWTGWGYWVEPHSLGFLSQQFSLVTRGGADWLPGQPVTLYIRDGERGAIREDLAPLVIYPQNATFRIKTLQKVSDVARVEGYGEWLMFELKHIKPLYRGESVGPEWILWACGVTEIGG